ncbi:hypothetical protein FFLO_01518 [Filobasidium floriforme]|uniref:Uncharacterized protein n=1 Tax=Filobasidium floriforme TaxID=5210 RepID=A0A8K0NSC2_9TREE|nr:uncharacterized protein HD553DRAFT_99116 [Filobasidium floriforme]KAG7563086.1 hypothetical protein FFLO_01518 [Filobasidium floriforme]KAH8089644.1 hypothetical protein HD553DRAFT_99116 [Filobasidium floriforme]
MSDDARGPQQGASNPETHLTKDGKPDQRFKENGGGQQNVGTEYIEEGDGTSRLATEKGQSSTDQYKPSEHGGKTKDGKDDKRMSSDHGFGSAEGADPHEAGAKGGSASYENGGLTQ